MRTLKRDGARSRRASQIPITPSTLDSEQFEPVFDKVSYTTKPFVINSIYNALNSLSEILLNQLKSVPRKLIKLIALIAPCYRTLIKISIKRCSIDMYVIYELEKLLLTSTITDICLDDCPINGADYTLLLNTKKLKCLSLARCKINDEICEQIASTMCFEEAAQNLAVLNLSSNHISDVGVKQIGLALRHNRRLRFLNLADNHISDEGAASIFNVLVEFQLTCEEIMETRKKGMKYMRNKIELCEKILAQLDSDLVENVSQIGRKMLKKRKTSTTTLRSKSPAVSARKEEKSVSLSGPADYLKTKAELMAIEEIGVFYDPFQRHHIKIYDDIQFCTGNFALSYLNFSYNNLSYLSIKKLENVLVYQNVTKRSNQTGLIKIVIDGNNLPDSCPEFATISNLLKKTFRSHTFSDLGLRRPKSRDRSAK